MHSFDETFERELAPLHRYLARRLGASAAEDIASETFAVAYRRWDAFDQTRAVRPWLYGIAANLMRHRWRDERRKLRAYARTGIDPVQLEEDAAIGRADASLLHRELAAVLAELRPQDREILLLSAWAELSHEEIAAALSLPVGTVKSRLHRTRERVRNRLEGSGQMETTTLMTQNR